MVGASDPKWLQGAFSALVAIFNRVRLQTNFDKTDSMTCYPSAVRLPDPARQGWQVMLTVLSTLVSRPTLLKMATSALKAP